MHALCTHCAMHMNYVIITLVRWVDILSPVTGDGNPGDDVEEEEEGKEEEDSFLDVASVDGDHSETQSLASSLRYMMPISMLVCLAVPLCSAV